MNDPESDRHELRIAVDVDYQRRVNFAGEQNGIPVVELVRIQNEGPETLEDLHLRIWMANDLSTVGEERIAELKPGETFHVETIDFRLDPAVLARQLERESTTLSVEIEATDHALHRKELPIEVLAHNEWGGLGTLPEILAAFVLPNHPAVARVLSRTADILRERTDSASLGGYQDDDPVRVRAMVRACYHALAELGVAYVHPPASFEREGQKVRLPGQILESKLGTCLDLALLSAACFEQMGLHPLLVLVEGHAFVGVWTVEDCFPQPAVDDAAALRKRVSLGEIVTFETTAITTTPPQRFEAAERRASRHLSDSDRFLAAIDVRAARRLQIRPLPVRRRDGTWSEPVLPSAPVRTIPSAPSRGGHAVEARPREPDREEPPASRLDVWRRKLLDLSLRNRLVNFRETQRTLSLMVPDLGVLEDALSGGADLTIGERPTLGAKSAPRSAAVHEERTDEDLLGTYLLEELAHHRLHAAVDGEDLAKRLVTIYRAARSDLQEMGANTLYITFGTLVWFETETSRKERRAPIILLPLQIVRRSVEEGFRIRLADDEPRANITLLEKIQNDFHVDITGLDELPEDASGLNIDQILRRFREAVKNMPRWDVAEDVHIGLFSFNKFLMWMDLEEHSEELLQSEVVRHLVETPGEPFAGNEPAWPAASCLDAERRPEDSLCPLDADSSQLVAVFAGAEKRTFVLQGPPGTGKSQTIANLIAHAVASGKRVLFVAEKMAALDVVHDRLSRVGLAEACLEIHSKKATKRHVLDQIRAAVERTRIREPKEWARLARRIEKSRTVLNDYVREMHEKKPAELSVYQATSRLIGLRDARPVRLELGEAADVEPDRLSELRGHVERLAAAAEAVSPLDEHPLRAVGLTEWSTGLPERLADGARSVEDAARSLSDAWEAASPLLGVDAATAGGVTAAELELPCNIAELLLATPGPERSMLTEAGWTELKGELDEAIAKGRERDRVREDLLERWSEATLEEDPSPWRERWRRAASRFPPFSWLEKWSVRRELKHLARGRVPRSKVLAEDLEDLSLVWSASRALAGTQSTPARLFGRHFQGGEANWDALATMVAWSESFRALLMRLRGLEGAWAGECRERSVALATDGRDQVLEEGPDRALLEKLRAARQAFSEALGSAAHRLELCPALAWGGDDQPEHLWRVRAWAERVRAATPMSRDWCHYKRTCALAGEVGLRPLVLAVEEGDVPPGRLRTVFERSFLEDFVNGWTDRSEVLRRFNSREHERTIASFRKLDRKLLDLTREVVRARAAAAAPRLDIAANDRSEVGILQRQLALKRRHLPIRRLFEHLPHLLPRLKPCLLMSPLSVAQYLAPGYPKADIIVFDEASQIPPWDAVGALARGDAAIIVGDSKQLPPTSFFQRQDGEDEDDEELLQELESILDECTAGGIKTLRLDWHYRSRHESLIAFSNHHYYDGRLLTFPSPDAGARGMGVSLRYFPQAVYDKGRSKTNEVEARAIVDEIVRRLREAPDPHRARTIGVVAFSQAQQGLIEDLLDAARRLHPEIEPHFSDDAEEPVFVKNLENVQGDERDVILFSVCYGPDRARNISMNFGPLNRQGGERRLNVAITRSRREVVVFTSLRPDQIDLSRTRALAVKHLKTFLDYAERGAQAMAEAVAVDAGAALDSPLEKTVRDTLVARGYRVDARVGSSEYRIDLGVRDPESPDRYLLGIECDGAAYRSAATARDRDRLRSAVLRRLGWKLHRIWSSDWWNDPEGRTRALVTAIEDARRAPADRSPEPAASGARAACSFARAPEPRDGRADPVSPIVPSGVDAALVLETYPRPGDARVVGSPEEFYEADTRGALQERIRQVVELEAPLHFDVLCRRVAQSWGLGRLGSRVRRCIEEAIEPLESKRKLSRRGVFVWRGRQDPDLYTAFRVPHDDDPDPRRAEEIPPEEIANAAASVLRHQISLPVEALERETARLFGIVRLGKNVRGRMGAGIRVLEARGGCRIEGGAAILPR